CTTVPLYYYGSDYYTVFDYW
nr:immunoglobulin heavy chain junction region [Macaca mulatta]MOV88139.1 immunoglobulin heavy chain junction region [Macaca mulatta]MOV89192.1 immunoglobulin heavy chain junction region [Macaca mulatta]MOV89298.1 immunoglobulin heavy chain junction region [Macaca mulatta]MOV89575.1 immunoglobulin heavy chain junction region [Macaca mulatta]